MDFYIFKNSYKIITFLMSFLEISNIFQLSVFTAGLAVTLLVTGIKLLITKIWRKKQPYPIKSEESLSNESLESVSLRKHLSFLKDFSQRIQEERSCITELLSEDEAEFEENVFVELENIEPSVHEKVQSSLKHKYLVQEQQAKDIFEDLEALESDFLILKSQMQHVTSFLGKQTEFSEPFFPNTAAVRTQTGGTDVDSQGFHADVSSAELVTSILTAAKESFDKLVSENRTRGKELIESISRFREQSHKDIQKELIIFSSAADESEHDDRNNANLSMIAEVENIEKNLLEAFIYFNRQRFDMESMKKTLTYFTKKFLYVSAKFDAYWQQSTASYNSSAQKLEDTEVFMSSATEKMSNRADCLLQQSKDLAGIIDILTMRGCDFSPEVMKSDGDIYGSSYEFDASWSGNVDHVNQKLNELMEISENSGEKLNLLTLKTKNLESLSNLINNMSEGYNSLLNFFLSSSEKPRKNRPSVGRGKSCQNSNYSQPQDEINILSRDDLASDENLWNHVLKELESEFPNKDIRSIIFILRDIIRTSWDLVGYGRRVRSGNERDETVKNNAHNDTSLQENDFWDNIQSESLLDNVTSDCLVQNSDESDGVSEES